MRCAGRRPHDLVAEQVLVDERAQRRRMPERRHAADREAGRRAREVRVRARPPARRTPPPAAPRRRGWRRRRARAPPRRRSGTPATSRSPPPRRRPPRPPRARCARSRAARAPRPPRRGRAGRPGSGRPRSDAWRGGRDRSATSASVSGKWQAARLPPSLASSGGSSWRQMSCAFQQRVWKRQAGGGLVGDGTSPPSELALLDRGELRVGDRHRRHQRARVGHPRMPVELVGARQLDDLPEVHDRDAVAHVAHDREVVGDEDRASARGRAGGRAAG